jgi:choline-glycine betaine transporter
LGPDGITHVEYENTEHYWAVGAAVLWAMSYFFFRKLAPGENRAMLEPAYPGDRIGA